MGLALIIIYYKHICMYIRIHTSCMFDYRMLTSTRTITHSAGTNTKREHVLHQYSTCLCACAYV